MNVEDVRRIITEKFVPQDGHDVVKVTGPWYSTKQSEIFIAQCPGFKTSLAVKRFCDRNEFDEIKSLSHIWQGMAEDGEFAVPQTIALLEEEAIAVTEWVNAPSFGDALRRKHITFAKARSFANRAGRWLRRYHKTATLPPGHLDVDHLISILENELEASRHARTYDVDVAVSHILDTANLVAGRSISQGQLHGDFKPENILISDARTVGIDFQPMHKGVVIRDLASFINHLVLIPYEPSAVRWFSCRNALAVEFLRGYTDGDAILPIECLAWLRLHRLVRLWLRQWRRTEKIRSWYLSKCLVYEMRRLCASEFARKD